MKLLASVLLSLSLLLSPSFSFARDAQVCASASANIVDMANFRDQGISKLKLNEMVDWDSLPKEYKNQLTSDIKRMIDITFDPKNKGKDTGALVKQYYNECLKKPDFVKETKV